MPAHSAITSRRPARHVAFSDTVEIIGTSTSTWIRQPVVVPEDTLARLARAFDYPFSEFGGDEVREVHEIGLNSEDSADELWGDEEEDVQETGLHSVAEFARSIVRQPQAGVPRPRGSSLNWRDDLPAPATSIYQANVANTPSTRTPVPLSPPPPYSTNLTLQAHSLDDIEVQANRDPVPSYNADARPPPYIEELDPEGHDQDDDSIIRENMYDGVLVWFQNVGRGMAAAWSGEWDAED